MVRFHTFTERARRLFNDAQDEARRVHGTSITTEDLLLALVGIEDGVGAMALVNLGVELANVRTAIEFLVGDRPTSGETGLTPAAKRVLELAIEEARGLGHDFVGTEHILLGLARESSTIASGVLESMRATPERIRTEVIRLVPIGSAELGSPRESGTTASTEFLTIGWKWEGSGDLGELIVTAWAKGFAGHSSAYFNASEILDFAAGLEKYPLPGEDILEIRSGHLVATTQELDEHVRITILPVTSLGQVAVVVHLAESWPDRPSARSEVRIDLLTTYERLRAFSSALARVIRGKQDLARLDGEVMRGT
jgi:hypothetical protein